MICELHLNKVIIKIAPEKGKNIKLAIMAINENSLNNNKQSGAPKSCAPSTTDNDFANFCGKNFNSLKIASATVNMPNITVNERINPAQKSSIGFMNKTTTADKESAESPS